MAILDSTVDRDHGVIRHEVLEADCKGNTPDNKEFNCPEMHSIEFIMRHKEYLQVRHTRKCFRIVTLLLTFKDIINHESFQSLVNHKWKRYGWKIFL